MKWLAWAPLGAAALHVSEEFLLPGGFMDWYRRYRPLVQRSITPRFLCGHVGSGAEGGTSLEIDLEDGVADGRDRSGAS